jgi:D-alanyl-D-alanine carboxypeptidase/D-alanyl-D-alanine-endopeptidase (penicillin-binding protein 4)
MFTPRSSSLFKYASALIFQSLLALPAFAASDLATRIDAILDGPDYRQARWGMLLVDADSDQVIYERHPDRLFLPASTTKLYTCATALSALGSDHRFQTPVYRRGNVKEERLEGDLILVASGDLTFAGRNDPKGRMAFKDHDHTYANFFPDSELTNTDPLYGLDDLARQIADAGIRHVDGDVLIDDRLFDKAHGSGSGPDLLTPIIVNDNVVDLQIAPGSRAGALARVAMRPKTRFIHIDAQVETVPQGKASKVEVQGLGANDVSVRGRIAQNARPMLRIFPVPDPAAFARALFIEALQRRGVIVASSIYQQPRAGDLPDPSAYAKLPRVALHTSLPFSEVIKVTLKVSHNLYASTLPLLVAAKEGKRTVADGLRIQHAFLKELGVDAQTISFAGGAGGANADATTPRATVRLLQALSKREDFPVIFAGLPILGVDGTLVDVLGPNSPAKGKAHAKTGTLVWQDLMNDRLLVRSKALGGTMTTAGGRRLTFAMFVNDVPLPKGVTATREGKVLGHLCEIIYEHCP